MAIKAYLWYRYNPTLGDSVLVKGLHNQQLVRVIKPSDVGIRHSATTFNGHVYVTDVYGQNTTMVFVNSLEPIGEHGSFVANGKTYHYEKESKKCWLGWVDGEDHTIHDATTFANLYDEVLA